MIVRRLLWLGVVVVGAAVLAIVLSSGSNPYVIKARLADANGLRQGDPVAIGGQDVGTISLGVRHRQVIVTIKLDRAHAPVGRNATVSVASVNLLGQKRIELAKGDLGDPAPSGYLLPAGQVGVTTDLDQVLDVLTPDVRTRLGILINEAGQAFVGRRADFSEMLAELTPDFDTGTRLIDGIAADNHTLAALVQHSDGFVSQLTVQRSQLVHLIDVVGQASATVAARRSQLAATLERAPATLATLQSFLHKLQNTTVPLGPAAVDITDTAPALDQTLAQIGPFRQAAAPVLRDATAVAPELGRLAVSATPVIRDTTPVVASLARASAALGPVTDIVNHSLEGILSVLQNWSRAIQFRDGLSHVFRGEAAETIDVVTSMIDQLQQAGLLPGASQPARTPRTNSGRVGSARPARTGTPAPAVAPPASSGGPGLSSSGTPSGSTGAAAPVTSPSSPPTGSSGGTGIAAGLSSLLSFLFGR